MRSDELVEQEAFILQLPLFTSVDKDKFQKVGLPTASSILVDPEGVGRLIPLFTDAALSKTLLERLPLPGKASLERKTLQAMRSILAEDERVGGQPAGIDSTSIAGKLSGRFEPIREWLDAIKVHPA